MILKYNIIYINYHFYLYNIIVGACDRGDSCRFSHEADGGGAPSGGRSFGGGFGGDRNGGGGFGGSRPSGVCYAFQRGECDRGSSCRFGHGGKYKSINQLRMIYERDI